MIVPTCQGKCVFCRDALPYWRVSLRGGARQTLSTCSLTARSQAAFIADSGRYESFHIDMPAAIVDAMGREQQIVSRARESLDVLRAPSRDTGASSLLHGSSFQAIVHPGIACLNLFQYSAIVPRLRRWLSSGDTSFLICVIEPLSVSKRIVACRGTFPKSSGRPPTADHAARITTVAAGRPSCGRPFEGESSFTV